jgi:hypothetical protein
MGPSMGEGWEGVMFPAAQVQNNEVPVNLDRVNQTIADKLGASPPPEPSPIAGGGLVAPNGRMRRDSTASGMPISSR